MDWGLARKFPWETVRQRVREVVLPTTAVLTLARPPAGQPRFVEGLFGSFLTIEHAADERARLVDRAELRCGVEEMAGVVLGRIIEEVTDRLTNAGTIRDDR